MYTIEIFYLDGSQSRYRNVESFSFDSSSLIFGSYNIRTCDVHEVILFSADSPICRCFYN